MCSVAVEKLFFYSTTAVKYSLRGTPMYSAQYVAALAITVVNTPLKTGFN